MADLALDANGDILIVDGSMSIVRGADALRQDLQIRLGFYQGEFELDTRVGFPWKQEVLKKNPRISAIRAKLRQYIIDTPGVATLDAFGFDFDSSARTLSVSFTVNHGTDLEVIFDKEPLI